RELAGRFAALLSSYWDAAFEEEWSALEPQLAATVADAGRRIAGDGVYGYLTGLSPQLLIDPSRREIRRDLPHEHTVDVGPRSELVLVPSVFVWPHVRVNCDPPWPPAIVYPAPFALAGGKSKLPSEDVVHVLRALADETRLRALKLIAAGERSTQELAPLIGISEAGLSKHLRLLARAGLVQARRDGSTCSIAWSRSGSGPFPRRCCAFYRRRRKDFVRHGPNARIRPGSPIPSSPCLPLWLPAEPGFSAPICASTCSARGTACSASTTSSPARWRTSSTCATTPSPSSTTTWSITSRSTSRWTSSTTSPHSRARSTTCASRCTRSRSARTGRTTRSG